MTQGNVLQHEKCIGVLLTSPSLRACSFAEGDRHVATSAVLGILFSVLSA